MAITFIYYFMQQIFLVPYYLELIKGPVPHFRKLCLLSVVKPEAIAQQNIRKFYLCVTIVILKRTFQKDIPSQTFLGSSC